MMMTYEEFEREKNDLDWALNYSIAAFHTGSQVICSPPPDSDSSDYDVMFLCEESSVKHFEEELTKRGFSQGGSLHGPKAKGPLKTYPLGFDSISRDKVDGLFHSWKKNFIVQSWNIVPFIDTDPKYIAPDNRLGQFINKREREVERKKCLNYILTCSYDYYLRFYEATVLSKRLNLKNKEDRISLFQAICDNKYPNVGDLIIKSSNRFIQ